MKALCSALSERSSAIQAKVSGTMLPPIEDTMYSGARCEKGPMTGVAASKAKMTMAIMLENKMTGHRLPFNGQSEIQTHNKPYTAVKALPIVGYVFCSFQVNAVKITIV